MDLTLQQHWIKGRAEIVHDRVVQDLERAGVGIDLEFALWTSLFAPSETPPAALRTIVQAVRQAVQDEQFRASMIKGNSAVSYMDGDEYAAAFRADTKKLQDTVRFIGKVSDAAQ
jgi:tripartite-type tricarboxylate transporter receptor subunit TctC